MLVRTFREPIYRARVTVLVGCAKEAVEWVRREMRVSEWDLEGAQGACSRFQLVGGKVRFVVWVEGFDGRVADQCNVAHEVFHLAHSVTRGVGVPACWQTEEALAYLFSYLMGVVWRWLDRERKVVEGHGCASG